jgi:hypothetical protein
VSRAPRSSTLRLLHRYEAGTDSAAAVPCLVADACRGKGFISANELRSLLSDRGDTMDPAEVRPPAASKMMTMMMTMTTTTTTMTTVMVMMCVQSGCTTRGISTGGGAGVGWQPLRRSWADGGRRLLTQITPPLQVDAWIKTVDPAGMGMISRDAFVALATSH